jgi:hypothetical protein
VGEDRQGEFKGYGFPNSCGWKFVNIGVIHRPADVDLHGARGGSGQGRSYDKIWLCRAVQEDDHPAYAEHLEGQKRLAKG